MADEKESWAQRTIRERRDRAQLEQSKTPAEPAPSWVLPTPIPERALSDEKRAEVRREVEALKDRPVLRARRIGQYLAEGMSQGDVALALGVQQPWVAKRMALLRAPVEVLQQIEHGTLTENQYYANRAEIDMEFAGRTNAVRRDRPIPVTIHLDAARALAEILMILADRHKAIPIRVDDKATKQEITEILNLRSREMRELLGKK
jgi:hypothetical protein